MEPIDEYIGQYWKDQHGVTHVRRGPTPAQRKRTRRILGTMVVIAVVLISIVVVVDVLTSIEAEVEVTLNYSREYLPYYQEREMWIFMEEIGGWGSRVGNFSQAVDSGSGSVTTTFTVNRTGTYVVSAGCSAGSGSVWKEEEVQLTRDDDGRTLRLTMSI